MLQSGFDLATLALEHGLVPLVYQHLREHDLLGLLAASQRAQLQALHQAALQRRLWRLDAAATIHATLRAAGLTAYLPLKGWARLASAKDGSLPREMIDLDLLVAPEQAREAYEQLQQAGCRVADMPWVPTPWEYHLPRLELRSVPIEVHWRLWPPSSLQPFSLPDFATLHARGLRCSLEGQEFVVPSLEDQFLIQAVALAEDAFNSRLSAWMDLYWILQELPADGGRLWEVAAEAQAGSYVLIVLSLLQELLEHELLVRYELPDDLRPVRDRLAGLVWRRLGTTNPVRPSLWMLTGLRRLAHRTRGYEADWGEKLPQWLQEQAEGGPGGWVVTHTGGTVAAAAKALHRLARLAVLPRERRGLIDDVRLVHALHRLALRTA